MHSTAGNAPLVELYHVIIDTIIYHSPVEHWYSRVHFRQWCTDAKCWIGWQNASGEHAVPFKKDSIKGVRKSQNVQL